MAKASVPRDEQRRLRLTTTRLRERHYLDNASTAPLRPEAAAALRAFYEESLHADPGRPYIEGRGASAEIEAARDELAALLGVGERSVVFTSSGTEAANWVNFSARAAARGEQAIACAGVEHSAVRLSAERSGPVAILRVDSLGSIDLDSLRQIVARDARPVLVHCQFANHEVATVQPLAEVIEICRAREVLVHVDACAAVGQLPLDLGALDADLVSLSAHKFGGPTGLGAIVLRRGVRLRPFLLGGDQERARRAGMENLPAIVALGAVARSLAEPGVLENLEKKMHAQIDTLGDFLETVPGVVRFGDPVHRLPHIICVGLDGIEAEGVVLGLDQRGIAVHSGSACSSEDFEPSPVLQAMGVDADHSLRCSVGWATTDADIEAFIEHFPIVLASLRSLSD